MPSTFSESWYQIAPLKLGLLPSARVHKQLYHGEEWYVLQDIGSEKYYRLRPDAYRFVCALSPRETVAETWARFVARYPEQAPGQEDVLQLLAQLHHANLLFFRSESDNDAIFKRYRKQKTRENLGKLMAFLYVRVPLWDPNDFLNFWRRILSPLFSPVALLIWVVVVLLGAKAVVENWGALWQQGQGILALSNLPLLYISIFVLKIFHEMGHAIVCKKYGGQVHTMGIMFIVFTPLPYIDATASWSMRSRWHRTFVGGAGMYVELFFAALAAMVWVGTGPGLVNSMAFNLMVAGSVSSILFNGNPLLRFDAYYMMADAIDIPNLYQKANQQWLYYADRWLLGTEKAEPAAHTARETAWLVTYGFLSFFYRLFVMVAITLMVADIWLGLGLVMVIMMLFIWLLLPLQKLLKYLLTSPRLYRNRSRAIWVSGGLLAGLLLVISWLPLPYSLKAPGVVAAAQTTPLFSFAGGRLDAIHVAPGQPVMAGKLLLEFSNDELQQDLAITRHQLTEAQWRYRQVLDIAGTDPLPFQQQLAALQDRWQTLNSRVEQLQVRAPHEGVWVTESLHQRLGDTLPRGQSLGQVVSQGNYRFIAVVSQAQAAELFGRAITGAEVRLNGQAYSTLQSETIQFIPFQRQVLPSPALGLSGGGSILTQNDGTGREITRDAFFEVLVGLPSPDVVSLHGGVTGYMRIPLEPRSLGWQLRQRLLQLVQSRYML